MILATWVQGARLSTLSGGMLSTRSKALHVALGVYMGPAEQQQQSSLPRVPLRRNMHRQLPTAGQKWVVGVLFPPATWEVMLQLPLAQRVP